MKPLRLYFVLFIMLSLALACSIPGNSTQSPESQTGPQSFIDNPQNNSNLPLAPVAIIYHATDTIGVSLIELSVNGQILSSEPNPDPNGQSVVMNFSWNPPAPGSYTLQVRAQNKEGVWGNPVSSMIIIQTVSVATQSPEAKITTAPTVENAPAPTYTPYPTYTPLPTSTQVTPTMTGTPDKGSLSEPDLSTTKFKCSGDPDHVIINITASDPKGIYYVTLFYRLHPKNLDDKSEWETKNFSPKSGGEFSIKINGNEVSNPHHWGESWFQYQIVLANRSDEYTRSKVYSDITIFPCP